MRRALFVFLALALTARAEQKNVKLLTGLTDIELQRAMNLIRGSLGVHCDYCHVAGEKWDFASDAKPVKVRARDMIRMVAEMNRTTFGGRAVVSCYTCHRGALEPATLIELPQTPPPFPTPVAEKPALADAKSIVAKYAAAIGDASKWSSRVLKGERTNTQNTVPIEVHEKDGKTEIPGVPDSENFRALADAFAPVLPSAIGADAKTIAKEEGRWVVERGRDRFWFDIESGLLVRRVLLTPRLVGTIPQQTDFEEWRDAGGAKFPFRVRVSLVDPWVSQTRRYTSVELGK